MVKNLFIGSLPFSTTEDTLRELFSQCGQVVSASVIVDKYTGQSRGFGFVEMNTEDEAAEAISKLNGYTLDGRSIVVKEATPKPTFRGGGTDQRSYRGGGNRNRSGGQGNFRKRW